MKLLDLKGWFGGDPNLRHIISNRSFGVSTSYQKHMIANGMLKANPGLTPELAKKFGMTLDQFKRFTVQEKCL